MDQACSGIRSLLELAADVIGLKGDVVDALTVFLDEFGNRAFRIGCFEQFQVNFADMEEGGTDLLRGHFFNRFALQSEGLFVVADPRFEGFDGDSYMVDLLYHELFWFAVGETEFGSAIQVQN